MGVYHIDYMVDWIARSTKVSKLFKKVGQIKMPLRRAVVHSLYVNLNKSLILHKIYYKDIYNLQMTSYYYYFLVKSLSYFMKLMYFIIIFLKLPEPYMPIYTIIT